MASLRKVPREAFGVGWICALPIEFEAACAMLDEKYDDLPRKDGDTNSYQLGRIGKHNVAITCLRIGEYGKSSATAVGEGLRFAFPQIDDYLMVGVGGGVPLPDDIRLGDVVVGVRGVNSPGVIEYDYGKMEKGEKFVATKALNGPSRLFSGAIPTISRAKFTIGEIITNSAPDAKFNHPGTENDQLFEADYAHENNDKSCGESCSEDKRVRREDRENTQPQVHYGTIASGDQVIKDATVRDRYAKNHSVKCFEMEAAGLMNHISCLVIRGICDYADSHKNEMWQAYAALTAAAYAKQLLSVVQARENVVAEQQLPLLSETEKHFIEQLNSYFPKSHRQELKDRKGGVCEGTCQWFANTPAFETWKKTRTEDEPISLNTLWVHGGPGTGKSMLSIVLTESLEGMNNTGGNDIFAYFFCDTSNKRRTTATAVISGLLAQLIEFRPHLKGLIKAKFPGFEVHQPTSPYQLWNLFIELLHERGGGEFYCIIDALDECDWDSQKVLLEEIRNNFTDRNVIDLGQRHMLANVHILFTSRPYREIERKVQGLLPSTDLGRYPEAGNDVGILIEAKVSDLAETLSLSKDLRDYAMEKFRVKAEGIFLWVAIVAENLEKVSLKEFRKTLDNTPQGLTELYQQLMDEVTTDPDERAELNLILDLVAVSLAPLTIQALSTAFYEGHTREKWPYEDDDRVAVVQDLIKQCRLLVVERGDAVTLFHKSVKDFLFANDSHDNSKQLLAHANLASRCIRYMMLAFQGETDPEQRLAKNDAALLTWLSDNPEVTYWSEYLNDSPGFLRYSIMFWMKHAHFAQEKFEVGNGCEPFLSETSSFRQRWLLVYGRMEWNPIIDCLTIFHISANWGILPLLVYSMKGKRFSETDYLTSSGTGLLELAAEQGHETVVDWLVESDRIEPGAQIFTDSLLKAAKNIERGFQLMRGLLRHPGAQNALSKAVLRTAASNSGCGWEILKLILGEVKDPKSLLDERVLAAGAGNERQAVKIIKLLLDPRPNYGLRPGEETASAAAGNKTLGADLVTELLKPKGIPITITEHVLNKAAWNAEQGGSILQKLLTSQRDEEMMTEYLWCQIIEHQPQESIDFFLLLKSTRFGVTWGVIYALGSRAIKDPRIAEYTLGKILDKHPMDQPISNTLVVAMVEMLNKELLSLIKVPWEEFRPSLEQLYEAAVNNHVFGLEIVTFLHDIFKGPIKVTAKMLHTIASPSLSRAPSSTSPGDQVIKYLLDNAPPDFPITCRFIKDMWQRYGETKLLEILQNREGDFIIDHDLFKLYPGVEEFRAILRIGLIGTKQIDALTRNPHQKRKKVTITSWNLENVLRLSDNWTIQLLVTAYPQSLHFHEKAIVAYIQQPQYSLDILKLILQHDSAHITESVLVAAKKRGHVATIIFLIDEISDEIPMTARVLDIMENCGELTVLSLVQSQHHRISLIDADMIHAISNVGGNTTSVLLFLLDQCNNKLTRDGIFAILTLYDHDVVQKLVSFKGWEEISLNDSIRAAIKNTHHGINIINLLLLSKPLDALEVDYIELVLYHCSDQLAMRILECPINRDRMTPTCLKMVIQNHNLEFRTIRKFCDEFGEPYNQELVETVIHKSMYSRGILRLFLARMKAPLFLTLDAVYPNHDSDENYWNEKALNESNRDESDYLIHRSQRLSHFLRWRKGRHIGITTNGRKAIFSYLDKRSVKYLLKREPEIQITDDIIVATISNQFGGESILRMLVLSYADLLMLGTEGWKIVLKAINRSDTISVMETVVKYLKRRFRDSPSKLENILGHRQYVPNKFGSTLITTKMINSIKDNPSVVQAVLRIPEGQMIMMKSAVISITRVLTNSSLSQGERKLHDDILRSIIAPRMHLWEQSATEDMLQNVGTWGTPVLLIILGQHRSGPIIITRQISREHHLYLDDMLQFFLKNNEHQGVIISNTAIPIVAPYVDAISLKLLGNGQWGVPMIHHIIFLMMRLAPDRPVYPNYQDSEDYLDHKREIFWKFFIPWQRAGRMPRITSQSLQCVWPKIRRSDDFRFLGSHESRIIAVLQPLLLEMTVTSDAAKFIMRTLGEKRVFDMLNQASHSIPCVEYFLCQIVRNFGEKPLLLFLSKYSDQTAISEQVLLSAASNKIFANALMRRLLEKPRRLQVTERFLLAALKNNLAPDVWLELLELGAQKYTLPISPSLALSALLTHGNKVRELLIGWNVSQVLHNPIFFLKALRHCDSRESFMLLYNLGGSKVEFTQHLAVCAAAILDSMQMKFFMEQFDGKILFDDALFIAAARNKNISTFPLLLGMGSIQLKSPTTIVDCLVIPPWESLKDWSLYNSHYAALGPFISILSRQARISPGMIKLGKRFRQACHDLVELFDKRTKLLPEILDIYEAEEFLSLLLERGDCRYLFTEEVVISIVKRWSPSSVRLLQARGILLLLTEKLLLVAMSRGFDALKLVEVLLDQYQGPLLLTHDFFIQESTLWMNNERLNAMMNMLLQRSGISLELTADAYAAAIPLLEIPNILSLLNSFETIIPEEAVITILSTQDEQMIETLFEGYSQKFTVTTRVLAAVWSKNAHRYSASIMELESLFLRQDDYQEAIESILSALLANRRACELMLISILRNRDNTEIRITQRILEIAAQVSVTSLGLILNLWHDEINITGAVILAAASHEAEPDTALELLLQVYGGGLIISDEVVPMLIKRSQELVESRSSSEESSVINALEILYSHRGIGIVLGQETMKTVIETNASSILELFLSWKGFEIHITQGSVPERCQDTNDPESDDQEVGSSNNDVIVTILSQTICPIRIELGAIIEIMRNCGGEPAILMLEIIHGQFPGQEFHITDSGNDDETKEEILVAITSRESEDSVILMSYFLSYAQPNYRVSERAALAAAKNMTAGCDLLEMIVEESDDASILTPTVQAAAMTNKLGRFILSWILHNYCEVLCYNESILRGAASNLDNVDPQLRQDEYMSDDFDDILSWPREPDNLNQGSMLEALLEVGREKIEITEDVLIEAANNAEWGEKHFLTLLEHLHEYPRRTRLDLRTVAMAIAEHPHPHTASILRFLFLHDNYVNENFLRAVVRNSVCGPEIITSLPRCLFQNLPIFSSELITAAMKNTVNGAEIFEILLNLYEGQFWIKDREMEEASRAFPDPIFQILRARQVTQNLQLLQLWVWYFWFMAFHCFGLHRKSGYWPKPQVRTNRK